MVSDDGVADSDDRLGDGDDAFVVTGVDPTASERLAEMWVALARGQQDYGSHLKASANRQRVQAAISQYATNDQLLVARPPTEDERSDPSAVQPYTDETEPDAIGFVMFRRQSNRYAVTRSRGLIENLYVVPDHRGRGVGSRLLAAAETRLSERGVDVVALEAMAGNGHGRRFYRRHGYCPHRIEFEKAVDSD